MTDSNNFFQEVYEVVKLIPAGRVSTYGAIAQYLSSPKAARMVGWAMNNSHQQADYIPAHRVVNRKGLLTGKHHFEKPTTMEEKLNEEGIKTKDGQILEFETVFWDPSAALQL